MGFIKRMMGSEKEEAGAQEPTPGMAQAAEQSTKQAAVEPQHLTDTEFDALILGETPVVVDFWAEWCGPCHAIAPSVAKLAGEFAGRIIVGKVNADDYPDILSRYGIMGIPTLIFFKGGHEVDRVIGVTPYAALRNKMERLAA